MSFFVFDIYTIETPVLLDKNKNFFYFFENSSFYVSEYEHAAALDVYVNLSAERYVAQSAR